MTFEEIVTLHREKYPLMKPVDFVKLAYQNEFGAEHLAADESTALDFLLEEMRETPRTAAAAEPIGNGLCRFHFSGDSNAGLIAKLFCKASENHKGSVESFERKLQFLETQNIPEMRGFLAEYRADGVRAVHHSKEFREAYKPHYRLLKTESAGYYAALAKIAELTRENKPVFVAVDGRCGSGKTRFAKLVAEIFPCNVIHVDDFYLPFAKRAENWRGISGGNIDFERILREIIQPIKSGKSAEYRAYNCRADEFTATEILKNKTLNIIEGSYSQHPKLISDYALRIFLTCEKQAQKERLQVREGGYFRVFEEMWIPMEERYFFENCVFANSDISVDTTNLF